MNRVCVNEAYNPARALELSKAWFSEIADGIEGDFGDATNLYLRSKDCGQFLADYTHAPGPTMGYCFGAGASGCGWPAPFGAPQQCDPCTPWLQDVNSLKRDSHYQLEDVMGLNREHLAQDNRAYVASMAGCTRTLRTAGGCKGVSRPDEKVALRSVPSYPTWYYG